MKILLLCKKFPYPLKDGEAIAVNQLSKSLTENGCEVTLLAMNTSRHHYKSKSNLLPKELSHFKEIHSVDVDNKITTWGALKNLFSAESYHISRFVSDEFSKKLIEILSNNQFDIIQLETLYLAPYLKIIKDNSDATVVMRAHNIEHEIWHRISNQIKFIPKKIYLSYLAKKLKRFEIEKLNEYDFLVAITERDLEMFKSLGYKNGCLATPVGFDLKEYQPEYSAFNKDLNLSFIGSLDWMPNIEGLRWFLNETWPVLHNRFPNLKFHFAGRNAPKDLANIQMPGVTFYDSVSDSKEFMLGHQILIVPIFAGSGIRVKILEAMALGRVVITSSIGLEGIPAKHLEQVILANTVEDYIQIIQMCYDGKINLLRLGQSAINFVLNNFDSSKLAVKLLNAYQKVIDSPSHI